MEFYLVAGYLKNFKSFIGGHTLDFEGLGLGTHRVRGFNDANKRLGSNGSGKSTFLSDALCWCFYGRTAAGLKNPDVRPWRHVKGPTIAAYTVNVGKRTRVIRRTTKPNRLTLDDRTVGQADIDRFLGMSFEVFTHTVLLAQGQPLFFDKSPREKMQLFSDVLRLDRWDARSKAASERAQKQQREYDRAEGSLEVLRDERARVDAELTDAKKDFYGWAERQASFLENVDGVISEYQKQLEKLLDEKAEHDIKLDNAGMQLKLLIKDVRDAEQERRVANSVYDGEALKVKNNRYAVLDMKKRLEGISFGATCPTCGQKIKGALVKHRAELRKKIKEREKLCVYPLGVLEAVDEADAKLDTLTKAKEEFEDQERAARDALDRLNPRIEAKRADIEIAKSRKKEKDAEENPHRSVMQKLKRMLRDCKEGIATGVALLTVLEKKIARSKLWIKGFKDMRLYLVEDVLQELTIATDAALEEVGLIGWSVEYTIEKEAKSGSAQQGLFVMIKSPANEKPVRWEAWSGGEGQRLRLIGALALAEVLLSHAGIDPRIEILDEPTRHMSPEGVRDVVEYLILRAKDMNRQIFLVDHTAMDSNAFASTVTIAKDRNGSYIVGGEAG
jgi:DNA repair exonuclease SbcCD ATPase subunit